MRRVKNHRGGTQGSTLAAVLTTALIWALATGLAAPAKAQEESTSQLRTQDQGQSSAAEPGATKSGTQYLFDNFNTIRAKPQPKAPWYVINRGSENGQRQRWEGQPCGSDSCVTAERDGRGVSFAKLAIFPSPTPGFYVNAELAEQRTGYAAGQPGRWKPAPGHPVVLNARVRWSANHKPDGSGGAQGSSGIWFWNSATDYNDPSSRLNNDLEAFGINWVTEDSALLPGLNASVLTPSQYGPYPVWSAAPSGDAVPNLQEWNYITMLWTEDASGQQSVRFWLDGRSLGETALPQPFGPLSLEIWCDNQVPTESGIEYRNPSAEQDFEVDYIGVARL